MNRALIVKQPYADLIMSGQKMLEMRSRHTNVRGDIGIIPKGSGQIIGVVELVNSWDYSGEARLKSIPGQAMHGVEPDNWDQLDKWCFGWELRNPRRFAQPVKYEHPQGAVIWVKLSKETSQTSNKRYRG